MGGFSADIEKFRLNTMRRADTLIRKVAIDTFEKVRAKTPVDTGQLRASWTVSLNNQPSSFSSASNALSSVKFGDTIFIATDKVYAPMLEYGLYPKPGGGKTINGFSIQAPKGMVRITVQEMEVWLKNNVRFA